MKSKTARKVKKQEPVLIGAVHALKRLEREEGRQYSRLKKAETDGDEFQIKVARDAWLKTSEGLRRFDILIEAARRETGELVPRRDVETWLNHAAGWLHFALMPACENDRDKAFDTAARAFQGWIASKDHHAPVPLWMGKALFSHCAWKNPQEVLLRWRRVFRIQEAVAKFPGDMKKICEHVETSMKADELELKGTST